MPAPIVVVLDDTALADQAAEALNALGYEATAIHDAMAALQALEKAERVDCLVTSADFRAPRRPNGLSLMRMTRLRKPALKTLFVVPPDTIDLVRQHGSCLATPTTVSEIASTVADMMKPPQR